MMRWYEKPPAALPAAVQGFLYSLAWLAVFGVCAALGVPAWALLIAAAGLLAATAAWAIKQ